jgi:hypothetical protein
MGVRGTTSLDYKVAAEGKFFLKVGRTVSPRKQPVAQTHSPAGGLPAALCRHPAAGRLDAPARGA